MEDTCLFAESLCFLLEFQFEFVSDLLSRLAHEASSVTLGDLEPYFLCLPQPRGRSSCHMIYLFQSGEPVRGLHVLEQDLSVMDSAGLFKLPVQRLAHDAIRDRGQAYVEVRARVFDIVKAFKFDQWATFEGWLQLLTLSSLEAVLLCFNSTPLKCDESAVAEFQQMRHLPQTFLRQVFEACKQIGGFDTFAVRRMLDGCGRYYKDGTPQVPEEELKQLCEDAQRRAGKHDLPSTQSTQTLREEELEQPSDDLQQEEEEGRVVEGQLDMSDESRTTSTGSRYRYREEHWFSCNTPSLPESEAQRLASWIYEGCIALKMDCRVLVAKSSAIVVLLVRDLLSRQKRAHIAKLFDQFVQDRKQKSFSWIFAQKPQEQSPLLVPPGLRQVVHLVRFISADELPPTLLLNVRGVRPLVLDWLKKNGEDLKEWQLRMVSWGRDLCDDHWVQQTKGLQILLCQDWTQWDDSSMVKAVKRLASRLPKRSRDCEFIEWRMCAALAYLCQAMTVVGDVPAATIGQVLENSTTVSPSALERSLFDAFLLKCRSPVSKKARDAFETQDAGTAFQDESKPVKCKNSLSYGRLW